MRGFAQNHRKTSSKEQVCRRRRRILTASLTVECAGILPVFFMACLTLITFMDGVRLQAEENLKLSNRARMMAMAAAVAGEKAEETWIDLKLDKPFSFPFPELSVPRLRIALRARVYPWVGSEKGIGGDREEEGDGRDGDRLIYLTDNQEVYHTHDDCTHLDLTIIRTDAAGVKSLRNAYGRKYRKCRGFPSGYKGPLYVTAKGDYYYPSTEFGSLTRHVHVVRASEAGSLKECDRCAARDRKEASRAA